MPLGHLMVGLLGGIAAVAAALLAGLPLWMAALLYMLVGNLCLGASILVHLLRRPPRRPPRRRARGALRRGLGLRPLRAGP